MFSNVQGNYKWLPDFDFSPLKIERKETAAL